MVEAVEVIVSMECGDRCPVPAGKRYLDWELEDPHGQGIEVARVIRDEIRQRVEARLEEPGEGASHL